MAREWKFETAVQFVRHWSGKDTDAAGVSDDFMEAEEFILDSAVDRPDQMAELIDVVIDNVVCGTRSDGRDINALKALAYQLRNAGSSKPELTTT